MRRSQKLWTIAITLVAARAVSAGAIDRPSVLHEIRQHSRNQIVTLVVLADSNGAQTRKRLDVINAGYPAPVGDVAGGHLQGMMFALRDLGLLGAAGPRGAGAANLTNTQVMGGHVLGDDGDGSDFTVPQTYSFNTNDVQTFASSNGDPSEVNFVPAGITSLNVGQIASNQNPVGMGSSIRPGHSPFTTAEIEAGDFYIGHRGLGGGTGLNLSDLGSTSPSWRSSINNTLFFPGAIDAVSSTQSQFARWSLAMTPMNMFDVGPNAHYFGWFYFAGGVGVPAQQAVGGFALNAWGYIPMIAERAFATGYEANYGVIIGGGQLTDALDIFLTKNQQQWNHYWDINTATQAAMGILKANQVAVVCSIFKGNDAATGSVPAKLFNGVGGGGLDSPNFENTAEGYADNFKTLHSVCRNSWLASGRSLNRLFFIEYPYHQRVDDSGFNDLTHDMQGAVSARVLANTAVIFSRDIFPDPQTFLQNDYYRLPSDQAHSWNGNPEFTGNVRERAGYNWFHHAIWTRLLVELAPCEADLDLSGAVDFGDVTAVLANWLTVDALSRGPGDANKDGVVDFADITTVLGNWASQCP